MAPNFDKWFERCVGSWESHRRYLYGTNLATDNIVTTFSVDKNDTNKYKLSWSSDRNTGEMNFNLVDDECRRDIGYYTSDPTTSKMTMIDEDTIVFNTSYGGVDYREEIRLLHDDDMRLRQTVGFKDGVVNVVGQYFEQRLT
jgi:hypothetical protein